MRCRKNIRSLSQSERDAFVQAIMALKGKPSLLHPGLQNRYDDFVEVHLGAMNAAIISGGTLLDPGWAHFDSAFFPWHRELLFRFEEELRDEVVGVTIPYWDWTREKDGGNPGFPFRHIFIGVDGNNANSDRVEREVGAASPYPHAFDPDAWTIAVKDNPGAGGEPDFLTRDFGSRGDAPDLPENNAVVTGVNTSFLQAIGAASYLSLRARSEDIHNLVHRWVEGNMITASSPNDPVFWMHHAAIDRMWTIWQQKNPGATHYQHVNGFAGHGLNDTLIFNEPGDTAPWTGAATPNQVIDSHAMHGESIWYESDLPDIVLDSPATIDFGPVPQDMTQFRAVKFRVRTCRPLTFRISGIPTGNFGLTPEGTDFPVMPDPDTEWQDVYVWIQFEATGPSPSSGLAIEAFTIDSEGYYAAAEGDAFPLGNWSFTVEASVVPRENTAVVLVLDRSYSMSLPAGGSSTRSELMKTAVGVFHALLRPAEEFGVVSFDHVTNDLLPLTTQSAGLGTTLTGNGLDPRGDTGIGLGIQAAASMLLGATHTNRSMLILTDGNENVHPFVNELPAGTVTDRTYAIGFGLPGHVSDAVLNEITSNTGGDLIISGTLDSDQERFLLTKYFVQMLAGVTSADIVLDPEGSLRWGETQTVEFSVAEADVSIDVIALCPVPQLLRFLLHAPDGSIIDPGVASAEPNVTFQLHDDVAFYRLDLPALTNNPKSHAGRWVAEFQLAAQEEIKTWLTRRDVAMPRLAKLVDRESLPYSCIVQTHSNLQMQAHVVQPSFAPGSELIIRAKLTEYGVPYRGSASLWATVTDPTGGTMRVDLEAQGEGAYRALFSPPVAGLYRFRVQAFGQTRGGHRFTREKVLTRGVFVRDPNGKIVVDWLDERDQRLCDLIDCFLSSAGKKDRKRLAKMGIDVKTLQKCLKRYCKKGGHDDLKTMMSQMMSSAQEGGEVPALMRNELLKLDPKRLFQDAPTLIDGSVAVKKRKDELNALRTQRGAETAHMAGYMLQPIEPLEKGGLPKGLSLAKDSKPRRRRRTNKK